MSNQYINTIETRMVDNQNIDGLDVKIKMRKEELNQQ